MLVRLALAGAPLAAPAPDLQPVITELPGAAWTPLCRGRALLAAVYDAHVDDVDGWLRYMRGVQRACLRAAFATFLVPSPRRPRALYNAARAWRLLHRGVEIDVGSLRPGEARVTFRHPAHAVDELGREELVQGLVVALQARQSTSTVQPTSAEAFTAHLLWRG